jgi:Tol biopolymer transport system component
LEAATLEGRRRHRLTPRRLQSEDRADFDPAVSPDRRRVAFVRRRAGGDSLWVVRLDGSGPRVVLEESQLQTLFSGALELRSLAWSPDGKTLTAVVDEANGDCESDG